MATVLLKLDKCQLFCRLRVRRLDQKISKGVVMTSPEGTKENSPTVANMSVLKLLGLTHYSVFGSVVTPMTT